MARSDELAGLFEHPDGMHRHFEICRAYFLERRTAQAIADHFALHPGTVQSMVRDFAADPDLSQFFTRTRPGRKTAPKREAIRERVRVLRGQHQTLGEIRRQLCEEGHEVSESYLATILREEGFDRLSRRNPTPRPGEQARDGSEVPDVADVHELCLEEGRVISTDVAGLFLFMPLLLEGEFTRAVSAARYPGTEQIPAVQAMLAQLVPKLLGKRRISHISDLATDEGAGLFAGLNVLPKMTYARLDGYEGEIRQLIFDGLGHPSPTFLLTNDLPGPLTAREVIQTYAQRNHVEHSLGEKITFFHLDCLCSDVRLNVDFDLTLTVAAAALYQRLASRLKGFAEATPYTLFRRFVNTRGHIEIHRHHIVVQFAKRTHNPILKEAGFEPSTARVPWLKRRSVRLEFP